MRSKARIAKDKRWREQHPDYSKNYCRRNRLPKGWTPELYDAANIAQDGKCAICKQVCSTGKRLAADHDPSTGKARALLCSTHNLMLGQAGEDPAILEAAAAYLRKYRHPEVV